MILDTSFLVALVRGDGAAAERADLLDRRREQQKLSSVTLLELYEGVHRARESEREREAVLDVLDSKVVVPADAAIMRRAGRISGSLYDRGEPIDREDCVIAASALSEGEPVLTGNAAHFRRIDGLDVETY